MAMFANTSMNHRVSLLQATASIKRWTLSNNRNWDNLIAHCSSPTKLAEPLSTHNFKMTGWLGDPHNSWMDHSG